jgi:hypothetical protein
VPVEASTTIQAAPSAAAGAPPLPIAPPPAAAAIAPAASTKAPLEPSPYYGQTATSPPSAAKVTPRQSGRMRSDEFEPEPARVVALEPGFAVIDMGAAHGVTADDHVAFERMTKERVDDEQMTERRERVAIGNAATVGRTRTRVALGIGERVEVGMRARPTRDPPTASSFAPPRISGVWHAGFMARPFLIVDNLGAGIALEGRAGYRPEFPVHFEALAKPVAVATGREGMVPAIAGLLMASFDSRLFEVGLGIGGQTMNDPAFDLESGSGTTIAQRLRIGAVDGGMIEVISYVVLFHSEFEFSDLSVYGQLPVGERSWLIMSGGAGSIGFGYAEVGLRVMLQGNGDAGTLFLSATIGGVHVFDRTFDSIDGVNVGDVDYNGPMLGGGVEWRF